MTDVRLSRVSRRTTLQWLAAISTGWSVGYSALPHGGSSRNPDIVKAIAQGYGTDPDLVKSSVPWPRTLNEQQLQAIAVLADYFLPGTPTAPAPSALGLQDFLDEWVSAPYSAQQADRRVILEGLTLVDEESRRRWACTFPEATDEQRAELIGAALSNDAAQTHTLNGFCRRFRKLIAAAYYTTPEGAKDIGYIGNTPLPSYPAVTDDERAILDAELRKLGIA